MAERKEKAFEFRAKLPTYVRYVALAAICLTVLIIVVGFYRERNRTQFRLKPEDTQLSKDVVAEVNGYERLETDGDVKKYYLKADHAKTFSEHYLIILHHDNGDAGRPPQIHRLTNIAVEYGALVHALDRRGPGLGGPGLRMLTLSKGK